MDVKKLLDVYLWRRQIEGKINYGKSNKLNSKKNKLVYVSMGADILHSGHLNVIKKAKKYGKVVVGLFTDQAIGEYKNFPLIDYSQRLEIMKSIKGIYKIVQLSSFHCKCSAFFKILNNISSYVRQYTVRFKLQRIKIINNSSRSRCREG